MTADVFNTFSAAFPRDLNSVNWILVGIIVKRGSSSRLKPAVTDVSFLGNDILSLLT